MDVSLDEGIEDGDDEEIDSSEGCEFMEFSILRAVDVELLKVFKAEVNFRMWGN